MSLDDLIYQHEATNGQYLFCLVLYLLILAVTYLKVNKCHAAIFSWLLVVVFCLFSYFDSDYFRYEANLKYIDSTYRDPIYYYIAELSFRNNLLYRLIIWGGGILLFYLTAKRLRFNMNIVIFVFTLFFLPTFSYARASLAMAIYFYGLSFICVHEKNKKVFSIVLGLIIISLSFFAHRSMLIVILLTPLALIKVKEYQLVLLVVLFPLVLTLLSTFMLRTSNEMLIEGNIFDSFSESAQKYSILGQRSMNWKYSLILNLKNYGFYLVFFFILWKSKLAKKKVRFTPALDRFMTMTCIIVAISVAFRLSDSIGATDILSYRFLFMAGIPIVFFISYYLQTHVISLNKSVLIMSCCTLSTIVFIVGKLLFAS